MYPAPGRWSLYDQEAQEQEMQKELQVQEMQEEEDVWAEKGGCCCLCSGTAAPIPHSVFVVR